MEDSSFISKLMNRFKQGNIVLRLLYINVAVFLILSVIEVVLTLFNLSSVGWMNSLELPASFSSFIRKPWTLLTYMFLHADILHILFNMLWLYWFGSIFLTFFSSKHLRGLYVLGGILGGIVYMVGFHVFPYFHEHIEGALLVGASASVLAIVIAAAVREPDYQIQFMFMGNIRLKYVALIMVALDLLLMTSGNAGGHLAHLGGALAGWWFAFGLTKGYDVTKWINGTIDFFSVGKRNTRKKPKMKVHYNTSDRQKDYDFNARKKEREEEIDRILDKLRKSGYNSLTTEEKKSLFDASKK